MAPFVVVALVALGLPAFAHAVTSHHGTPRWSGAYEGFDTRAVKRNLNPIDLLVLVVLIGFSGFRAISVGTDTPVYAQFFTRIDPAAWNQSFEATPFEPGYTFLALIVKFLGGDFTALLVLASTITVGATFWAIKRSSLDFPLAITLYVLLAHYLTPMNVLRQGLAVSIVFLATTVILKRVTAGRLIGFTLLVGTASSFHTTALVVAIAILALRPLRLTLKRAIWILGIAAMATAALWTSGWLGLFITWTNPRYEVYSELEAVGGVGTYLILFFTIMLVLYALALKPDLNDLPLAAFSVAGCFALLMGTQSIYAVRLADYFTIFLVLLVPNAMKVRRVPAMHRIFLVLFCGAYFIAYLSNFGGLTPYSTSIPL